MKLFAIAGILLLGSFLLMGCTQSGNQAVSSNVPTPTLDAQAAFDAAGSPSPTASGNSANESVDPELQQAMDELDQLK